MEEIVILNNQNYSKAEPITTSEIIAKATCRNHKTIINLIENNKQDLDLVDKSPIVFEIREGITTEKNKYKYKIYKLTRPQAMLLLTHMKDNKASDNRISKFKLNLIKKFDLMERELLRRQETRLIGTKIYRRNFTDLIQYINSGEEIDNFVKFSYKNFTDLIYKKVFNKTAKQLRIEKKLKDNQNLRDYIEVDELEQIQFWEEQVRKFCIANGLIKLHSKEVYNKVKSFLLTIKK